MMSVLNSHSNPVHVLENLQKQNSAIFNKHSSLISKICEEYIDSHPEDHETMVKLGDLYREKKDNSKAFSWYLEAQINGNFDALDAIHKMYIEGKCSKNDFEKSEKLCMNGKDEQSLTPEEQGDLHCLRGQYLNAYACYKQQASPDNPSAMYKAAKLIQLHPELDHRSQIMHLYTNAALAGYQPAKLARADYYRDRDRDQQDIAHAELWYNQLLEEGNQEAWFRLKDLYEDPRSGKEEDRWFKLAQLYQAGIPNVEESQDQEKAIQLYKKAATARNTKAMIALGNIYLGKNDLEAQSWYQKAAAANDLEAQGLLAQYFTSEESSDPYGSDFY
jgi:TPR repeat protein